MINPFIAIWGGLITLIMAIPFCIAAMYVYISVRQWIIAGKENSAEKRTGAIKGLAIALVAMLIIYFIYLKLLEWIL